MMSRSLGVSAFRKDLAFEQARGSKNAFLTSAQYLFHHHSEDEVLKFQEPLPCYYLFHRAEVGVLNLWEPFPRIGNVSTVKIPGVGSGFSLGQSRFLDGPQYSSFKRRTV